MEVTFNQISPVIWEVAKGTKDFMNVPARIFASEDMLSLVMRDRTLVQLINVTSLPGIISYAMVMPDAHEGYGFPIGAVAATDMSDGVISPGGIGYDINCGIRLLKSNLSYDDIKDRIDELAKEIYKYVPSGVGKCGRVQLSNVEMDKVLNKGCNWADSERYTEENDLRYIESGGSLDSADASAVSRNAVDRGRDQLGTMGAGNHFVEVNRVQKIFDEEAARAYGLKENQVVIQIHTGSRGLGHQVATDYIKQMISLAPQYGITLPDRELSCVPISSPEGQSYFAAMSAAANFAWTNRQLITWEIREAWRNVFGKSSGKLSLLYDVAHNIAKIEEHTVMGEKRKVLVHRKGATRAFPAGHPEVTPEYRNIGQPVLIPGSMGTSSYVLAGLKGSMVHSFGSTCHGAGRLMSRTAARKQIRGDELKNELNEKGINIQTGSLKGLAEEAPAAYKNVESVVDVVEKAGIAKKIVKLKPIAVIKG
ncbi:MAG: RNA-splicing ligase RtcB [Ignavibacteria bacterium GWB2_35_12]|nr:MAG: RNA-splicing ligase RtcB [Ignavibacteria bacterium GWB2_35_12]OGU87487.1 MAG: RNA-splicing ligase RtcB [Ignavibacteria bacterium RIFOXYA2_FULL_35_10]OGV25033.1 MAG: RNA-splicing ligase RtcB [Ignavibacteria bacterium RIFOXYC2_FULL_35_21]